MIFTKQNILSIAVSIAALFALSGCGNGQNTTSSNAASTTGSCYSGYIYSSTYGTCLQQTSACYGSYALYNGSCILVTSTTNSTTCSSGYVYSSTYATCLQQTSSCYGSYAIYNNSCVYVGTTTSTTTTTYQGSCQSGYIQTYYGCFQQGVCIAGYGYYNGLCYKSVYYQ